jgi:hypothetical protein
MDDLEERDAGRNHHQHRQHGQKQMNKVPDVAVHVTFQRRSFIACILDSLTINRHVSPRFPCLQAPLTKV